MVEQERFSEPEPNVIESTAGFCVRVLGRTGMRYFEGDRSAWLDSEVLARPGATVMFSSSIKAWDAPNDSQPLTDVDRERIVSNTMRAFEGCGYWKLRDRSIGRRWRSGRRASNWTYPAFLSSS